jgi:ferric-dicitrate binding protein FerR (iron transport regulator)
MDRELISDLGRELSRELDTVRASSDALSGARARFLAGEAPASGKRPSFAPSASRRDSYFRTRSRRVVTQPMAIAAILVAAAIALFFGFRSNEAPAPLAFSVQRAGAETEPGSPGALLDVATETPLLFTDGTRVTLRPASKARVTDVDHRGARVILESGSLHAAVTHKSDTRWNVDAGPFEVHVTGTRFIVAWDPARQELDVTLEEGSVVVSGCGKDPQSVRAGEAVHLGCTSPSASSQGASPLSHAVAPASSLASSASAPASASASASASAPSTDSASAPASAVGLAPSKSSPSPASSIVAIISTPPTSPAASSGPRHAPRAPGELDDALVNAEIRDLARWADDARYAGRLDEATSMLEAVRRRAPGTEEAANAAFELGRIAFDGRAMYARAATSFETYLHERPQGRFAREALGRSIEARQRAGDPEAARRTATEYLQKYPTGPHGALAHRVLGDAPGSAGGGK